MPKKRKLIILVNPFSGQRLAVGNWAQALPIMEKAHVELTVIMTERVNHAYEMMNEDLKIGEYDGVICVSGDGLIHEVVNGLYRRKDWM
jgi:sphingosine kinase